MQKVVITGATGMIGITLIEYLLKKKIKILAIVRENSAKKLKLPQNKNLKIVECNLDKLSKLDIKETNYDVFYHFAWDGTFGEDRNNLLKQTLNIKYTLDAIELASKLGCKTFIGAGSQAEYGRVNGLIYPNTSTFPENGYGIAKLAAGQMSRIEARKYGIKHIWARIFSVYGPYDGEKTMVMSSVREMITNNTSPKYTKAEQMWDYIYSKDVAKAFYMIAKNGRTDSIYCIASGEPRPLNTYINDIKDEINPEIKLDIGSIPYGEKQVMSLIADITSLKTDTGFIPDYNFKEGIKETIEWYKESSDKYEKN